MLEKCFGSQSQKLWQLGKGKVEKKANKDDPLILGVTGGIASGKSTVAEMLENLGAPVIDFDRLAREVVEPGQPALKEIVSVFGQGILKTDGTLDRKKLSKAVFSDPEKRKELESIIHPRIIEIFKKRVKNVLGKDAPSIIQAVIPLLFEVRLEHLVHKILLVYAPRETQIQRLIERDGISAEDAAKILGAQLPIDEKLGRADFVIRNEGSLEDTQRQVRELWEELQKVQNSK